jgi:hypothetical protein
MLYSLLVSALGKRRDKEGGEEEVEKILAYLLCLFNLTFFLKKKRKKNLLVWSIHAGAREK